jgi:hypothetical protein
MAEDNAENEENEENPSALIDAKIAALDDWRGRMLAHLRDLIRRADPDVVETVKWRKPSNPAGVPVWEHAGILCTGELYKTYGTRTIAKGAALPDPVGLFNASLEGNTRRAIDLRQDDQIDGEAFTAIIRAAVALNTSVTTAPRRRQA